LGIELAGDALSIRVALAERLQGGDGLCKEWGRRVRAVRRAEKKVRDTLSETEC
jgi:hypothetical protein